MQTTDRGYQSYGRREDRRTFERLGEQVVAYLRSRTADHWLMFAAGVVVGAIFG